MQRFFLGGSLRVIWLLSLVAGLTVRRGLIFWVCLEVNLLCFIFMLLSSTFRRRWSAMKYFLVQSIGSALFFLFLLAEFRSRETVLLSGLRLAIALKLAFVPFQGWLLNMLSGLSWAGFTLLLSVQKVLPLYVLIYRWGFIGSAWLILGVVVSCVGGLQALQLGALLVYSSLLRMSWILRGFSFNLGLLILIIYGLGLALLTGQQAELEEGGPASYSWKNVANAARHYSWFALLSLRGVPPLAGFFPKLALGILVVSSGNLFLLRLLLVGRASFIWFYLRACLERTSGLSRRALFTWIVPEAVRVCWILLLGAPLLLWLLLRVMLEFESKKNRSLLHEYNINIVRAVKLKNVTLVPQDSEFSDREGTFEKGTIAAEPVFAAHLPSIKPRRLAASLIEGLDRSGVEIRGRDQRRNIRLLGVSLEAYIKGWANIQPKHSPKITAVITKHFSLTEVGTTAGVVGNSHPKKAPPATAQGVSPRKAAQIAQS